MMSDAPTSSAVFNSDAPDSCRKMFAHFTLVCVSVRTEAMNYQYASGGSVTLRLRVEDTTLESARRALP